jgi:hypothetical protein
LHTRLTARSSSYASPRHRLHSSPGARRGRRCEPGQGAPRATESVYAEIPPQDAEAQDARIWRRSRWPAARDSRLHGIVERVSSLDRPFIEAPRSQPVANRRAANAA